MQREVLDRKIKHNLDRILTTAKWVVFSIMTGVLLGLICSLFYFLLGMVTNLRTQHWQFVLLLPVGAVIIRFMYHLFRYDKDGGTNLVLSAIHSNDEIPLRVAPLIFLSTLASHLCGASVGREGAALQLGGSIGNTLGRLFKFSEKDKHIMIMCGMSAAFSALFGTPMAAAIFSMEVVSVGIMHYAALVPCVISSFVARGIASYFGVKAPFYELESFPAFGVIPGIKISIISILCGLVSICFCIMLRQGEHLSQRIFKNPYLKSFVGGTVILAGMGLVGSQTYAGAGIDVIHGCIEGDCSWENFILKMLFTALAITSGYKGGEIVPTFFIGASFGCMMGQFLNISPSLCAAVGMGAVFCGVTNSPITSLLICLELFGLDGMPYYLISIAFSYMVSGYYGLYSSQKIIYSKYKSNYINTRTK